MTKNLEIFLDYLANNPDKKKELDKDLYNGFDKEIIYELVISYAKTKDFIFTMDEIAKLDDSMPFGSITKKEENFIKIATKDPEYHIYLQNGVKPEFFIDEVLKFANKNGLEMNKEDLNDLDEIAAFRKEMMDH